MLSSVWYLLQAVLEAVRGVNGVLLSRMLGVQNSYHVKNYALIGGIFPAANRMRSLPDL